MLDPNKSMKSNNLSSKQIFCGEKIKALEAENVLVGRFMTLFWLFK